MSCAASNRFITTIEGQQITSAVATFSDPGGAEPVGEYSASIAWGDGNTTPGLILQTGANSYQVSFFHAYADESPVGSPYQITVTVTHGSSTAATGVTADGGVVHEDPLPVLRPGGGVTR